MSIANPRRLELALAIQGSREGRVVQRSIDSIRPSVWCHALDAVLGLVSWELTAQFVSCDVRLWGGNMEQLSMLMTAVKDKHAHP